MIEIPWELSGEIGRFGAGAYPFECGGMLIGKFEGERRILTELLPMENAVGDVLDRVLIVPKDVLRAERYARGKGLDVIGYYHSHPDDVAVPSQFDLDHALPVWSYVIVSVIDGKPIAVRSWVLENDRSRFNEEIIVQALSASSEGISG